MLRLMIWLASLATRWELRKQARKASKVTIALLVALSAGCTSVHKTGGYHGPLVDPNGLPIDPPTYEAAP